MVGFFAASCCGSPKNCSRFAKHLGLGRGRGVGLLRARRVLGDHDRQQVAGEARARVGEEIVGAHVVAPERAASPLASGDGGCRRRRRRGPARGSRLQVHAAEQARPSAATLAARRRAQRAQQALSRRRRPMPCSTTFPPARLRARFITLTPLADRARFERLAGDGETHPGRLDDQRHQIALLHHDRRRQRRARQRRAGRRARPCVSMPIACSGRRQRVVGHVVRVALHDARRRRRRARRRAAPAGVVTTTGPSSRSVRAVTGTLASTAPVVHAAARRSAGAAAGRPLAAGRDPRLVVAGGNAHRPPHLEHRGRSRPPAGASLATVHHRPSGSPRRSPRAPCARPARVAGIDVAGRARVHAGLVQAAQNRLRRSSRAARPAEGAGPSSTSAEVHRRCPRARARSPSLMVRPASTTVACAGR